MNKLAPLCAVMLLGTHVFAQTRIPAALTLQEAERLTLLNNPRLKTLAYEIEARQADIISATKRLNPVFSFDGDGLREFNKSEMTFRVDQEFELAGKRRYRIEAAELDLEVQRLVLENERVRLLFQVRETYLRAALAARSLDISRSLLADIDSIIEINRVRLREGDISPGELKRVEVERARFLTDLMSAELALANEKTDLLALMGQMDLTPVIDIADPLPENAAAFVAVMPQLSPLALHSTALERRRELQTARKRIERFASETRLQRALRTPNITAGAGYKRDQRDNELAIGISIPLPLFNRNEGGIARALAERARAETELAEIRTEVARQVQSALNAVETNQRRVDILEREFVGKARETRDISLEAYRLGGFSLTDFLDAERAYRETLRTYNEAIAQMRLSLYRLAIATGMEGSL